MRYVCLPLVCVTALLAAPPLRAADPDPKAVEFFEAKVRPVLVENCYQCHSAQSGKARGNLTLDTKAALLKGGDRGPAVVPGNVKKSLLLAAIRQDGELKMPPKTKLPDAVVNDFRRWVEMGAPDPRDRAAAVASSIDWTKARAFWSFRPVRKPAPPAVKDAAWPKTDADRFVLARLEAEGLRPVAAADRRTLIRRATFDLTGLPPTPDEIDTFLKDQSPDAFAKVVDRLLKSPHYGERWARHWLDVARYAEDQAHTFGVKPNTEAYRYRDWVIDALNADMPYDLFVKRQIAADLMEGDDPGAYKHRPALGFFGLGAQYYKNSDAARAAADELDDRIDTLARGFLGLTVSCARCHDHKFDPIPTQDYYSLAGIFYSCKLATVPVADKAVAERYAEGQRQVQEADSRMKDFVRVEKTRIAEGQTGDVAAYLLAAWKVKARRQAEPKFGAAEQAKADGLDAAALDRWLKLLEPASKAGQNVAELTPWRSPSLPPKGAVPEPGADVVKSAREFQERVKTLLAQNGLPPAAGSKAKAKDNLTPLLFGDNGVFAVADNELAARLSSEGKAKLAALQTELDKAKKSAPPAPPMAHAIADGAPTDLHVYVRGNPAQQGDPAPRRFLYVLAGDDPPRFTKGSGRLELAEAVASKDNPLTPRVIVNRVWQWHFGRGLVGTPSNFGQLGERPTHPELLDDLAARFVESGWSLKWLHREIMLSATYQEGSDIVGQVSNLPSTSAGWKPAPQADPDNRLHWRMSRRRLEVEAWRDALLAVSGQLDRSFGGPTTDLGSAQNRRRTVYGKVSRHDLNGLLRLFDFPDANITSERRTETTVPQQQLFVLNSPFFVGQAKALAGRVNAEEHDDTARVRRAYLLAYGRPPDDAELALARRYLGGKDDPAEAGHNGLTRWERYAQALLAANEFLYID